MNSYSVPIKSPENQRYLDKIIYITCVTFGPSRILYMALKFRVSIFISSVGVYFRYGGHAARDYYAQTDKTMSRGL